MIVYYQILFWDYFGRNIHKGLNFLASLYPMKYLNPFLLKETLLDIAILLISIFFIEIGYLCWWNFCFLISVSPTSIFFFIFIYAFKNLYLFEIYNFPLFFLHFRKWLGKFGKTSYTSGNETFLSHA